MSALWLDKSHKTYCDVVLLLVWSFFPRIFSISRMILVVPFIIQLNSVITNGNNTDHSKIHLWYNILYPNSMGTNHITVDVGYLITKAKFIGSNWAHMDNSEGLSIKHIDWSMCFIFFFLLSKILSLNIWYVFLRQQKRY